MRVRASEVGAQERRERSRVDRGRLDERFDDLPAPAHCCPAITHPVLVHLPVHVDNARSNEDWREGGGERAPGAGESENGHAQVARRFVVSDSEKKERIQGCSWFAKMASPPFASPISAQAP